MEDTKKTSRRDFFKFGFLSAVAVTFLGKNKDVMAAGACPAKEPAGKKVQKEGEGMGKVQQYVADSSKAKSNPAFKDGSHCGNCNFYQNKKPGQEVDGHAPCTMMGNAYVSTCGWCKAYKARV